MDKNAPEIEEERAMVVNHHLVTKAILLCKRTRSDIQLAVGLLSMRVKAVDEYEWKKLRRMVQSFRSTTELPLNLEADESRVVKWWVDAAFAVH